MSTYGSGFYGVLTYGTRGIRMTYNQRRKELFIAKGSDLTYILSKFGLSAVSARIEAVVYRHDELIIHSPSTISQEDITLRTNILTLGSLGSKRILGVEAEVLSPDDVFISIDYRTNREDAFTTSPEVALDKDLGYCKFDLKGVEFRVNFRVDGYTSMKLNKANVRYSYLDRRKRGK